jgi:hypothetical protein
LFGDVLERRLLGEILELRLLGDTLERCLNVSEEFLKSRKRLTSKQNGSVGG